MMEALSAVMGVAVAVAVVMVGGMLASTALLRAPR